MIPPNDMPADMELREQVHAIMLITGKKRGQRIKDAILQLIKQRDAAIRIDELERSVEQTEMQRGENGFNVPYNYIERRKAELTALKAKGGDEV